MFFFLIFLLFWNTPSPSLVFCFCRTYEYDPSLGLNETNLGQESLFDRDLSKIALGEGVGAESGKQCNTYHIDKIPEDSDTFITEFPFFL